MNIDDMKYRFEHLYKHMAESDDRDNMTTFGMAAKQMFYKVAPSNPSMAQEWLDMLEGIVWNNYLTKVQAESITNGLINQDGSKGPHWNYDTFKNAVESINGKMQDPPYYNCWALWTTANMLYSDHYQSASEFVPKDMIPKYFYNMSIEKLKDVDRPKFVRKYFEV